MLTFFKFIVGTYVLYIEHDRAYIFFKGQQKKIGLIAVMLVAVGVLNVTSERVSILIDNFFLKRLEIVDGRLKGDNRTHQIEAFFEIVDLEMTLKGDKASGNIYAEHDFSSNPFSIYYGYGIFIWIPYAALEVWLLYCSFFYRPHLRFPALAMFLILLQRPYLYSLYWSIMICIVVVTIYLVQRNTVKDKLAR